MTIQSFIIDGEKADQYRAFTQSIDRFVGEGADGSSAVQIDRRGVELLPLKRHGFRSQLFSKYFVIADHAQIEYTAEILKNLHDDEFLKGPSLIDELMVSVYQKNKELIDHLLKDQIIIGNVQVWGMFDSDKKKFRNIFDTIEFDQIALRHDTAYRDVIGKPTSWVIEYSIDTPKKDISRLREISAKIYELAMHHERILDKDSLYALYEEYIPFFRSYGDIRTYHLENTEMQVSSPAFFKYVTSDATYFAWSGKNGSLIINTGTELIKNPSIQTTTNAKKILRFLQENDYTRIDKKELESVLRNIENDYIIQHAPSIIDSANSTEEDIKFIQKIASETPDTALERMRFLNKYMYTFSHADDNLRFWNNLNSLQKTGDISSLTAETVVMFTKNATDSFIVDEFLDSLGLIDYYLLQKTDLEKFKRRYLRLSHEDRASVAVNFHIMMDKGNDISPATREFMTKEGWFQ